MNEELSSEIIFVAGDTPAAQVAMDTVGLQGKIILSPDDLLGLRPCRYVRGWDYRLPLGVQYSGQLHSREEVEAILTREGFIDVTRLLIPGRSTVFTAAALETATREVWDRSLRADMHKVSRFDAITATGQDGVTYLEPGLDIPIVEDE